MDFSRNLTMQLDVLTEALDGSGDDLDTIFGVLFDDLSVAITSFVGLSITVPAGQELVTVTAMNSHTAASSMLVPLNAANAGGGQIVFYAQNPGAFTDLAADTAIALGPGGDMVLDGHLPSPTSLRSVEALADRSIINQGVGFLIEQGHSPAQAQTELGRRATAAGVSVAWVAHQILESSHRIDPDAEEQTG
ncbi:MAG: hypothetical protein ACR2M5_00150 [Nakamurella sp.]